MANVQGYPQRMRLLGFIFGFCIQLSMMVLYYMFKQWNKPVLTSKEPWIQENGFNKFRTLVSEVSSFVANLVYVVECVTLSKCYYYWQK